MIDYKSIGRRVSLYRKRIPMTQSVLSERLGVTEGYISQVECGSSKVSLSRLSQIAQILEVDIALLVSDKVTVSPSPINTEIFEIIKDWPAEEISFLADMLIYADAKMRKPKL